jgi:hypothetical protein
MKIVTLISLLFITANVSGQVKRLYLEELVQKEKIKVFNRELTARNSGGRSCIHLSANKGDGVAWIEGLDFSNGVIEMDLKGKDVSQESFVGVAFHVQNEKVLDAVYFRPFNFQSKDAVKKSHSVQYVSHPDFPWNVLREKYAGKYEQAVNPAPGPDDWFHVKIVLEYPQVTVYVNRNTEPSLTVTQLNQRTTGKLGVWVGNGSDGDFTNLQIQQK